MDISHTLEPNSDQLDAIELIGGPRTFTVTNVTKNNAEQPINIELAEFPRPWRPGKSMRRVLAACWGTDASTWTGRRVTLYCDDSVRFGNDVVGGTRIAALSHIDKPKKIPLLISRGKSATFTVQPLTEDPPMTSVQAKRLVDLFTAAGIERSARLALVVDVVGRNVKSPNELSATEADAVIAHLERMTDPPPNMDGLAEFDPATTSVPVAEPNELGRIL